MPCAPHRDHAGVYVSDDCHIGTHDRCSDGQQRPPEPESGIRYEVCSCTCHPEADR